MKSHKQAFTLIELLVVVLIIGILAAVALPQYQKAVKKSEFVAYITWLQKLYQAEQLYQLQTGTFDTSLQLLPLTYPDGTTFSGHSKFGSITFPNGLSFNFNSNNNTIQFNYQGITNQLSLKNGIVACFHRADPKNKKICQQVQQPGYTCGPNDCTLIKF